MRILFVLALLAGGCTTVAPGREGRSSSFFVGATVVRLPQTRGDVSAVAVRSLGLGWDRGLYIGWRAGDWISANPANCQLLVVIRSAVEAENAVRIINALEGQNPCIVDYTHMLRR